MSINFGGIMVVGLQSYGVSFEGNEEKDDGTLVVKISVPETSYHINARGQEMAGDVLAKRAKKALKQDCKISNLVLLSRVRKGEHWTKEQSDAVIKNNSNLIFN